MVPGKDVRVLLGPQDSVNALAVAFRSVIQPVKLPPIAYEVNGLG